MLFNKLTGKLFDTERQRHGTCTDTTHTGYGHKKQRVYKGRPIATDYRHRENKGRKEKNHALTGACSKYSRNKFLYLLYDTVYK